MTSGGLDQSVKRLGRLYRLERYVPIYASLGLVYSVAASFELINPKFGVLGAVLLLGFYAPVNVLSVAREINRRLGDHPDVLCAVELGTAANDTAIELIRSANVHVLGQLRAWRLGVLWPWLLMALSWCAPLIVEEELHVKKTDSLGNSAQKEQVITANDQSEGRRVSRSDALRTEIQKVEREPEMERQRSQTGKGKGKASILRAERVELRQTTSDPIASGVGAPLVGLGVGGPSGALKLTDRSIHGKVEVFKAKQINPFEQYPIEYHEAIRQWFLKSKSR